MTKLIIHPGSPKTATSTIQHVLAANRAVLSDAGVGLILPQDFRNARYIGNYMRAYRAGDPSTLKQVTADFFGPFLDKHKTVICSCETFCHDFMPSRKRAFGGIDRSEFSAEVITYTGAASTEVVLTIRPQRDFLRSVYTHVVHRQGEMRNFKDWLEAEVDLPRVLWQPAVRSFRDRFDEVRVISLTDGHVRSVMDAFGLGQLKLSLEIDLKNPSLSGRAVRLARIMNKEIRNKARSERLNNAILLNFPVSQFGKFKPRTELPAEIQRLYDADLAAAMSTGAACPDARPV